MFPGNNHCYQLLVEKKEWLEAQQHCQELGNGDLAFVSSPDIQSFLVAHVIRWVRRARLGVTDHRFWAPEGTSAEGSGGKVPRLSVRRGWG